MEEEALKLENRKLDVEMAKIAMESEKARIELFAIIVEKVM